MSQAAARGLGLTAMGEFDKATLLPRRRGKKTHGPCGRDGCRGPWMGDPTQAGTHMGPHGLLLGKDSGQASRAADGPSSWAGMVLGIRAAFAV